MQKKGTNLKVVYWYIVLLSCVYFVANIKVSSLIVILSGFLILIAVLFSIYLWIARDTERLPIFPVFLFTLIFKYALPIVTNSLLLEFYSPVSKFYASFTIVVFIVAGALGWSYFLFKKTKPPKRYLSLPDKAASINTFLAILFLDLILTINNSCHWFYLGVAIQNFLDLAGIGTGLLGIFFLSYRWGSGDLKRQKFIFIFLFVCFLISSVIPVYLIEAMTMSIAMIAGYFLGSKKVPVVLILMLFVPIFYLQYGKTDMRTKYWDHEERPSIQPWQYPSFLKEWFDFSFNEIAYRKNDPMFGSHTQPLLERTAMIQLLLMVQDQTPSKVPYFQGATYAHILESMEPRFLNAHKVTPLIGGRMLSVRYGLIEDLSSEQTSIAWDMIIESYVNFGLFGCIILGFFLGGFFGYVEYWCAGLPILSFRFLYGATVLLFAFKASEMALNTFIVSLLQTTVGLLVIALFLMRFHKFRSMVGNRARLPSWINAQNQGLKTD